MTASRSPDEKTPLPKGDALLNLVVPRLKRLRDPELRGAHIDAAAHEALTLASMLFDALAGWARDHVIGRTVQGIQSAPYAPGTMRELKLGDDRPWDNPELQNIGSDYEFDDHLINKKLIIELLNQGDSVLGHKLTNEVAHAFDGLLFGQQYELVKPELVRFKGAAHELWYLRFAAVRHVHYLMGTGLKKGKAQGKVADAYGLNDTPTVSGRETLVKWERRLASLFDAHVIKDSLEGAFNNGGWHKAWSERSELDEYERQEFAELSRQHGPEALAWDGQRFASLSPNLSKLQPSE